MSRLTSARSGPLWLQTSTKHRGHTRWPRVIVKAVVSAISSACADRLLALGYELAARRVWSAGSFFWIAFRLGLIIFDDYGWKIFYKQKEATDSFMAGRRRIICELPTAQGLMIKR
jgi:hypothetical protein